ncbi:hypothetical protein H8A95_18010 [Bradyrhizobium sp. Pear76]|uniref:hypothetical protein n=1 Tax=Bradyrhizobium oropedii TaxID=1571201 RepID=UPI001E37CFD5|nr:hypothetical protein [Bradyrhizobium oropedii]MCC8964164.1 hypothetical protein [Bradyrhizobium oropedii]
MRIIVLALSILFAGAITTPLFVSDAYAQQNPPKAGAKKAGQTAGQTNNRPCRSRNRACY